jgi:hypothetical protein
MGSMYLCNCCSCGLKRSISCGRQRGVHVRTVYAVLAIRIAAATAVSIVEVLFGIWRRLTVGSLRRLIAAHDVDIALLLHSESGVAFKGESFS